MAYSNLKLDLSKLRSQNSEEERSNTSYSSDMYSLDLFTPSKAANSSYEFSLSKRDPDSAEKADSAQRHG
jgi:hypothetical protein